MVGLCLLLEVGNLVGKVGMICFKGCESALEAAE